MDYSLEGLLVDAHRGAVADPLPAQEPVLAEVLEDAQGQRLEAVLGDEERVPLDYLDHL